MPLPRSPSLSLIETFSEVSAANREGLAELRRIASLDQAQAQAVDQWFLTVQDLTLSRNAVFEITAQFDQALKNYWYQLGGPYDPALERSVIEGYRTILEDSDELLSDLSGMASRGRPIEGADLYEQHVRQAREILEEDAIRRQAECLMPSIEKLDVLAARHRQSVKP